MPQATLSKRAKHDGSKRKAREKQAESGLAMKSSITWTVTFSTGTQEDRLYLRHHIMAFFHVQGFYCPMEDPDNQNAS